MDKKTNQYDKDDFVDVVDENDVPLEAPVPKRWLGTDLLPPGTKKATAKATDKTPDKPVEIPAGEPTTEWTVPQVDKYAADNKVDLGEAKNKGEKLPLIVAHFKAGQTQS